MDAIGKKRTRVAAYGIVMEDQRILLCRLSPRVTHAVGHWTLPGGGVEFGEEPAQAVEREVYEETGLRVRTEEILNVSSRVVDWAEVRVHAIRIIYRTRLVGADRTLQYEVDGSTDLCAWHDPSEAVGLPLSDVSSRALEMLGRGVLG